MGRATGHGPPPTWAAVIAAAAVAVLAALLSACSDDGGNAGATSTTVAVSQQEAEIGAAMATRLEGLVDLTEDQQGCMGVRLGITLGDGALAAAQVTDSSWTPEQREALVDAMNDCVDGPSFAPQVTEGFYSGLGGLTPDEEVVDCVAEQFDGSTGVVTFEALDASTTGPLPESLYAAFDACIPNDDVIELMTTAFARAGLTPAQSDCVANQLVGKVTLAQFAQISADSGSIPAEVQAAVDTASAACAGAS